jgi:hypothetical protein
MPSIEQLEKNLARPLRQMQVTQSLLFLNKVLAVSRGDIDDPETSMMLTRLRQDVPPFVVYLIVKYLMKYGRASSHSRDLLECERERHPPPDAWPQHKTPRGCCKLAEPSRHDRNEAKEARIAPLEDPWFAGVAVSLLAVFPGRTASKLAGYTGFHATSKQDKERTRMSLLTNGQTGMSVPPIILLALRADTGSRGDRR